MPFKRLLNLTRRRPDEDRSTADEPTRDVAAVTPDDAPLGPPPMLRPAAIFRQLLFDPAEITPVWARPRPAFAPPSAPEVTTSTGPLVDRPAARSPRATGKVKAASAASGAEPKSPKPTRRPKASGAPATSSSAAVASPPSATRTRSKRVAKPTVDATGG
jgi:hypothetical protein